MLKEVAVVSQIKGEQVELMTQVKTTCGSCEQQRHCGTGIISRVLAPKPETLLLNCPFDVQVGQRVIIAVAETAMLKLAFLIYFAPILCLLFAALALHSYNPLLHDAITATFSLSFVLAYFFILRAFVRHSGWARLEPKVVGVVPNSDDFAVKILP